MKSDSGHRGDHQQRIELIDADAERRLIKHATTMVSASIAERYPSD